MLRYQFKFGDELSPHGASLGVEAVERFLVNNSNGFDRVPMIFKTLVLARPGQGIALFRRELAKHRSPQCVHHKIVRENYARKYKVKKQTCFKGPTAWVFINSTVRGNGFVVQELKRNRSTDIGTPISALSSARAPRLFAQTADFLLLVGGPRTTRGRHATTGLAAWGMHRWMEPTILNLKKIITGNASQFGRVRADAVALAVAHDVVCARWWYRVMLWDD